jgi:hypothetical protein
MDFGLILFGQAISHFMIAFAALEKLGRDMGLGRIEGRYRIQEVQQLTLDGSTTIFRDEEWLSNYSPIKASQILSQPQVLSCSRLNMTLTTRLRLKNNNRLVRNPPSFRLFFNRLAGRLNSLGALHGSGILLRPEEKMRLLSKAKAVQIDHRHTRCPWDEWQRPTKPGREPMNFGGLLGKITYEGNLSPFIPWLTLGQWTGLGGKTSFGLGLYSLDDIGDIENAS